MPQDEYGEIVSVSSLQEERNDSIDYLSSRLKKIIKSGETVVICFPTKDQGGLGALMVQAVVRNGGVPIIWEEDLRWKELLRLTFVTHASTIIAPPLVVLGLSKIASYERIPLNLYNAVLAGYPCLDWMMDGIENGLDCRLWGCYGPGQDSVISGFSCECGRGIHLRSEKYRIAILDEKGNSVPHGTRGRAMIQHRLTPEIWFDTHSFAEISAGKCPCGDTSEKLVNIDVGDYPTTSLFKIAEDLMYWNSILDCRLEKTECGLEIEVVCFSGEKLPRFPSCAKLIVRTWDKETDCPLSLNAGWMYP